MTDFKIIDFADPDDVHADLATICFAKLIVSGADRVETEFVDEIVAEVDPDSPEAEVFVRESIKRALDLLEASGAADREGERIMPKLPRDAMSESIGRMGAAISFSMSKHPLAEEVPPVTPLERALRAVQAFFAGYPELESESDLRERMKNDAESHTGDS